MGCMNIRFNYLLMVIYFFRAPALLFLQHKLPLLRLIK